MVGMSAACLVRVHRGRAVRLRRTVNEDEPLPSAEHSLGRKLRSFSSKHTSNPVTGMLLH